jgi:hypothetical protein
VELISTFKYFDIMTCLKNTQTKGSHSIQFSLEELSQLLRKAFIPNQCLLFYKDGIKLYADSQHLDLSRDYFPNLLEDKINLKYWDSYKTSKIIKANNCSVKLFSIDNYSSFWHVFKQSFDFLYNCDSSLNYYYTPAKAQCFKAHSDPYDLFILQTEGSKNWKVFNKVSKKWDSFHLTCGDTLFIAKDTMHEAITEDIASGHVTLGFKPIPVDTLCHMIKNEKLDLEPLDHIQNTFDLNEIYLSKIKNYYNHLTELDIALYFINKDISKMNLDFYLDQSFFIQKNYSDFDHFTLNDKAYYKILQKKCANEDSFHFLGNGHICEISRSILLFLNQVGIEQRSYSKEILLHTLSYKEINFLLSVTILIGE